MSNRRQTAALAQGTAVRTAWFGWVLQMSAIGFELGQAAIRHTLSWSTVILSALAIVTLVPLVRFWSRRDDATTSELVAWALMVAAAHVLLLRWLSQVSPTVVGGGSPIVVVPLADAWAIAMAMIAWPHRFGVETPSRRAQFKRIMVCSAIAVGLSAAVSMLVTRWFVDGWRMAMVSDPGPAREAGLDPTSLPDVLYATFRWRIAIWHLIALAMVAVITVSVGRLQTRAEEVGRAVVQRVSQRIRVQARRAVGALTDPAAVDSVGPTTELGAEIRRLRFRRATLGTEIHYDGGLRLDQSYMLSVDASRRLRRLIDQVLIHETGPLAIVLKPSATSSAVSVQVTGLGVSTRVASTLLTARGRQSVDPQLGGSLLDEFPTLDPPLTRTETTSASSSVLPIRQARNFGVFGLVASGLVALKVMIDVMALGSAVTKLESSTASIVAVLGILLLVGLDIWLLVLSGAVVSRRRLSATRLVRPVITGVWLTATLAATTLIAIADDTPVLSDTHLPPLFVGLLVVLAFSAATETFSVALIKVVVSAAVYLMLFAWLDDLAIDGIPYPTNFDRWRAWLALAYWATWTVLLSLPAKRILAELDQLHSIEAEDLMHEAAVAEIDDAMAALALAVEPSDPLEMTLLSGRVVGVERCVANVPAAIEIWMSHVVRTLSASGDLHAFSARLRFGPAAATADFDMVDRSNGTDSGDPLATVAMVTRMVGGRAYLWARDVSEWVDEGTNGPLVVRSVRLEVPMTISAAANLALGHV